MKHLRPLILLFLLASCGPALPIYQTNYEIVPPEGENGQMCANNCLLTKTICEQNCQMQEMNCRASAQMSYNNSHFYHRHRGRGFYSPMPMGGYYNCNLSPCYGNCMQNYHVCHGNCGGQVIPHTYCTANCNPL